MSGPGRGRGESKHVHLLDKSDAALERDRQAQLEAARELGIPEGDIPIRGRGGFRQQELRTIPENVNAIRTQNLTNVRQIDVMANYVQIQPMAERVIQTYRVDFEPQVESQRTMRFLFNTMAGQTFTSKPIYDGVHECRSGQRLNDRVTRVIVADQRGENREYTVVLTRTGEAKFGSESLRIYNMQMKEFLRTLGYYSPQTGIFVHPSQSTQVGDDLMMMRGWRTAANIADEGKLLMNLEGAHKLMQRANVLEMMTAARDRCRGDVKKVLESLLVGKIVVTSYNKRCYKIEEIDFTMKPTSTFDRNGTPMSFIDYYRTVHNLTIRDQNQPVLKCVQNDRRRRDEGDNTVVLIPELCNIAGMTEDQRANGRLKFELIKASQVAPTDRVAHMRAFLQMFHSHEQIKTRLSEWGYSYATDPLKLKAYVIPPTAYAYGDITRKPASEWFAANPESADINVKGLAVCPKIHKIVVVTARPDIQTSSKIKNHLKSGFDRVGLAVTAPISMDIPNGDSPADYINTIRNIPPDTTISIIIMNRQQKDRYDAIKKAASVERGLVTQVVTARLMTDDRKASSAAVKIAIQIAAKIGGEPWWVDISLKGAMVCGYDTYHDTAQRGRSFGAFLASMNAHYSRWWSKADAHDRMEEISTQVAANMTEAVKQYHKANHCLPQRIIIYRDGVGEGQLEHVFKVELKAIRAALDLIGGSDQKIKLTMIVVSKRIGARFYMRAGANFANPPPGTVVDHTVTRHDRYDFYLVSQSTRQGTVTPTYYNIIHDEAGFPPEVHQKMAYKLCLLYYNWAGTVRVPAPCQYAHKLALLCGEHLHAQPNSNLDNFLHFL